MKPFRWSPQETSFCGPSGAFEMVVVAIDAGGLVDIVEHPNSVRYPHQRVLVVISDGYAYLVPFVEEADHFFLKTVIPSRKATRVYLGGTEDAEG